MNWHVPKETVDHFRKHQIPNVLIRNDLNYYIKERLASRDWRMSSKNWNIQLVVELRKILYGKGKDGEEV